MAKKERLPGFWVRKYSHQEELRTVVLSLRKEVWKAYEGLFGFSFLYVFSQPLVLSGRRTEDDSRCHDSEPARVG